MAVVLTDGTVAGENPGTAIITVETEDGSKKADLTVTVTEATSLLEKIEVENVILEAGTSQFVNVKTTPANAKYSRLKVKTYNDVVTVTPFFNTFTIDNETAKLPETLLTVEPYNIIQEDAAYYKIKLPFNNGAKIYPVNAVKKYPANSKVEDMDWDILLPADSSSNQVLYKNDDNSVTVQGIGKGVITVGVLGHNEIKPVIFDVEVVSQENQINIIDKHCQISGIEVKNEAELISKLSKVGSLVMVIANINYASSSDCGIRIEDYKIETSDKNIIDIIDDYAYAKKAGTANFNYYTKQYCK